MAMVLPSGESCASVTSRPTARGRMRSASSSVPCTVTFTGCAPGVARSRRQSESHTQNSAVLPSTETARSRMSSSNEVSWVPPSDGAAENGLRQRLTLLPLPRSVR